MQNGRGTLQVPRPEEALLTRTVRSAAACGRARVQYDTIHDGYDHRSVRALGQAMGHGGDTGFHGRLLGE